MHDCSLAAIFDAAALASTVDHASPRWHQASQHDNCVAQLKTTMPPELTMNSHL